MRLVLVHADRFEFETVTPAGTGSAGIEATAARTETTSGETEEPPASGRTDDCVTAFATVERGDIADLDATVANAATEVRAVADRLGVGAVALSPSEHLSDDCADAEVAATVFRKLETDLGDDFEVLRAPVGWYTAFELSSKGHPLAEHSVRVGPDRNAGRDAEREEAGEGPIADRQSTERTVAFPDGEVVDARDAVESGRLDDETRAFVAGELGAEFASESGSIGADERRSLGENERRSVVERLREYGLADVAGATDAADVTPADALRWLPRGVFARDLLAEYVTGLAVEYGATVVETSGAGGLGMDADETASEADRPLRRYETVARRSPDGRAFTTPEIRAATRNAEQAREELRAQVDLCRRAVEGLAPSSAAAIRTTREVFDESEAWFASLVADVGEPVLFELSSENRRDPPVAVDVALVDDAGAPVVNATVEYKPSAAGEETLHCTPVGSIECALAGLLASRAKGTGPRLPTWLAPTQVRFVPVDEAHVDYCDALAEDLDAAGVRADVDDREETVGERVARAETDLVPYYAVVGDREVADSSDEDDALAVAVRAEEREREMDPETLRATVRDEVAGFPRKRRYLGRHLSERPDFSDR